MVAGRTGLSSVGLGVPSVLAPFARGAPDMAGLVALTLAVCAVAGFARAALRGSPSALAVGVVDAAAGAVCWLAWWLP